MANTTDFTTYCIGEMRRLRRDCACDQTRQSPRCLHTHNMDLNEGLI